MNFAVLTENATHWEYESDSYHKCLSEYEEIKKTQACMLIAVLAVAEAPDEDDENDEET